MEVIDLRTIRPLDIDAVIDVCERKQIRLVILEEAWPYGNISTEISYQVQEKAFDYLRRTCQAYQYSRYTSTILTSIVGRMVARIHEDVIKEVKEVLVR